MSIFETFSKRYKKLEQVGQPDIYRYDSLPKEFRVQVIHIWRKAIGHYHIRAQYGTMLPASMRLWQYIYDTFTEEIGALWLGGGNLTVEDRCIQYFMEADVNRALDLIDLTFHVIDSQARNLHDSDVEACGITLYADDAIADLNHRFQEHKLGYELLGGELIKLDSQYIHKQVVRPAISLLQAEGFRGAEEEFLHSHEHYREGRYKEAIVDALKAFESTMKSICDARKWLYSPNDPANKLINIMFDNDLVPSMLQAQFAGLRSLLESGLPTLRNRTSSHGQGVYPVEVPEYIAAYALHMAASNIVFWLKHTRQTSS